MNRKKRILSASLVLVLLAGILFSYKFIIDNAHHDCSGEECPVCLQIEAAIHFLSSIKFIPVLSLVVAAIFAFPRLCKAVLDAASAKHTLVSLKVKLLN